MKDFLPTSKLSTKKPAVKFPMQHTHKKQNLPYSLMPAFLHDGKNDIKINIKKFANDINIRIFTL